MKRLALLIVLLSAPRAWAVPVVSALGELKAEDYRSAAQHLYEALQQTPSDSDRQDAEYGLAQALSGLGYQIAGLVYYRNVLSTGPVHKHYLDSVRALLKMAHETHDEFVVPAMINARYNADAEALARLSAEERSQINYMIGALEYRRSRFSDSRNFLQAVAENSPEGLKAKYVRAVISVRQKDNVSAIKAFEQIERVISPDVDSDSERARIRRLAILGQARCAYALKDFKRATAMYATVPRYTDEWFDAIFESGWAYYQEEDYGRALGQVESVLSPYFEKRFRPEAYVLAATVYYSNCQWDRTRGTLDKFKQTYESEQTDLQKYLAAGRRPSSIYNDLISTSPSIPLEILRQVRRNGRFLNLHRLVAETIHEQGLAQSTDNLPAGRLREELKGVLKELRDQLEEQAGTFAKAELERQQAILGQFVNQARLVKFETATHEKEILETGGDVTAKQRKRLPRPDIPSDKYQHWNDKGEYWVDELGYYVHGVRKECLE